MHHKYFLISITLMLYIYFICVFVISTGFLWKTVIIVKENRIDEIEFWRKNGMMMLFWIRKFIGKAFTLVRLSNNFPRACTEIFNVIDQPDEVMKKRVFGVLFCRSVG